MSVPAGRSRYNSRSMHSFSHEFELIVVGGGHAGAEAAWAGANLGARVALVTLDPSKTGAMSCNPAIGGLAKGQMVREIDALGGLMGLAADATGIQFRVLNQSKGSAVHGSRCQSDKYRYAREVQRLLATREQITTLAGTCEDILLDTSPQADAKVRGILFRPAAGGDRLRRDGSDQGSCLRDRRYDLRPPGDHLSGHRHTGGGRAAPATRRTRPSSIRHPSRK